MPIIIVAQQPEPLGQRLADSFTVQNSGEYQANYQSLGIEIDPPEGAPSDNNAPAAGPDNVLAPGQTLEITINVARFGDTPGIYYLKGGYNSVPTQDAAGHRTG